MQNKVEDLAEKMVITRQIKDSKQRMKAQREQAAQRVTDTADNFFNRKTEIAEKAAAEHEQKIREMEVREAELLEKIKKTQGVQLKEFNKLEEAIYEQQIGVRQRLQQNQANQGNDSIMSQR